MLKVIFEDTVKQAIGNHPEIIKGWVRDVFEKHHNGLYVQPPKTYLHTGSNTYDRAIALPAYIKGDDPIVGLKWIGSHSENVGRGIQRASAVIILNDPQTMAPETIVEGSSISTMRTFAMTLLALDKFLQDDATVGVIGMGKLGRMHSQFLGNLYPNISEVCCYSATAGFDDCLHHPKVHKADSLPDLLDRSDVIVTTSMAKIPYIFNDDVNKKTYLIVNISLMDFGLDVITASDHVIVDDWQQNMKAEKVFREGVLNGSLTRDRVLEMGEVLFGASRDFSRGRVFVNPLGMGMEDIYVARQIVRNLHQVSGSIGPFPS